MKILDRITSLRSLMQERGVAGYLIFGTDPHLSEYVPATWRTREWISGFTGSFGKVAITKDSAALWTDSRYFIQAEKQLSGTGIEMIKDRQADTISVDRWFAHKVKQGEVVAVDGRSVSAAEAATLEQNLGAKGFTLDLTIDLVSPLWSDRPKISDELIVDYPVQFAGKTRVEKLEQIRNQLTNAGCDATIIGQLDDLAWCFNLRGNDITYNPLFTGYGYIDHRHALLFVDQQKISKQLLEVLEREGVEVMNYESIFLFLEKIESKSIYLDPDRINSLIYQAVSIQNKVITGISFPTLSKSVKNQVEIAGMRAAHVRDGVAMVNFLYWFYHHPRKERITELSVAQKLREFRADHDFSRGDSFAPIVAFGPHGAIVHYSANGASDVEIQPDGILLIDSGGQYLDGTTDITRTISTGRITAKQQTDFTLVLKGMIQLAMVLFPENTKGSSLDILARKALWNCGLNYGHGTGHGVGHYLSVHEGPMSIRQETNSEPIRSGQIVTDEPGLYREGEYGIRIENVLLCKPEMNSDFGNFLSFDVLTLCPIETKLINRHLLDEIELLWLNSYHERVFKALGNQLHDEIKIWLAEQCAPI